MSKALELIEELRSVNEALMNEAIINGYNDLPTAGDTVEKVVVDGPHDPLGFVEFKSGKSTVSHIGSDLEWKEMKRFFIKNRKDVILRDTTNYDGNDSDLVEVWKDGVLEKVPFKDAFKDRG